MHIVNGHIGGAFETLPGRQQSIAQAGIKKTRLFSRGGNFRQQRFQPRKNRLRKTSAILTRRIRLAQNFGSHVRGQPPDGPRLRDANPHFEIGRLLNQDVFLRGKQPEQIAPANLIFAIGEQVKPAALRHQIELQFRVMMHCVRPAVMAVMPQVTIETGREFELLAHDDKK